MDMMLLNEFENCDNFSRKIPESISDKSPIDSIEFCSNTLSYSFIKYECNNIKKNCIMREFIGDRNLILLIAFREQSAQKLLKNIVKLAEIYIFYFEDISQEKIRYAIIYQNFEKSFANITDLEETRKNEYLFRLLQILEIMKQNYFFHGSLNPRFIYIDENNDIVLANLMCAFNDISDLSESDVFSLVMLDDNFLAPEALIKKYQSNVSIEHYDFFAADVFSFGLIALFVFNSFQRINSLNGDGQDILYQIYRKKVKYNLPDIENPFENDSFVYFIVDNCLEYRIRRRITYDEITSAYSESYHLNSTSLMVSNNFLSLIKDFTKFLRSLISKLSSNFSYISGMKKYYLDNHYDYLEESYEKFLSTNCKSDQINVEIGIAYFICSVYRDLKNQMFARKFISSINKYKSELKVAEFLLNIFNLDRALQDYVVIGLIMQSIELDWNYFFPSNLKLIKYKYISKLTDFPYLMNQIKAFTMNPFILDILSRYCPPSFVLNEDIITDIFDRIYLIDIQPSSYGLTTYNGNIFISRFLSDETVCLSGSIEERKDASLGMSAERKGAILITILHEMGHALRRYDCINFKQSKNRYTPKNDCFDFADRVDEKNTENQFEEKRGEAGYNLELSVLGEPTVRINEDAANYLFTMPFDNPKFRKVFHAKNKSTARFICLAKSRSNFCLTGGVKCAFMNRGNYK